MQTKLCDFCGKEIPVNSKICPFCNKALQEKIFTYMSENKPKSDSINGLDVSKYISISDDKPAEDYFKTNIYSFSEKEIERTFARKDVVFDEEERENQNIRYKMQREYIPQKRAINNKKTTNKRNTKRLRKGDIKTIATLSAILFIIILLVCLFAIKPFSSSDNQESSSKTSVSNITTTKATETTVETTIETTTITTTITSPSTYSYQSIDLDGYLGLSYSSFKSNFNAKTENSETNEIFGGTNYYYDGMIISTDSNSKVVAISVDYSSVSNKDTYRYQDITYYSYYNQVIDEFGEPKSDQIDNNSDRSVAYTLDIGSGLSIKFKFDDNKKVSGFDVFYAD